MLDQKIGPECFGGEDAPHAPSAERLREQVREDRERVERANGVAARHSSESVEHYTPVAIVEAARATLGAVDLDPASCATANDRVRAAVFYDAADNGFGREWGPFAEFHGARVFLNPPGGKCDASGRALRKALRGYVYADTGEPCETPSQSSAKAWWFKLASEYVAGRVSAAIFVAFSLELLQSAQVDCPVGLPTPLDFALCFPTRRVGYLKPDGSTGASPPHASCIVYLGPERRAFANAFAPIGRVINCKGAT